MTAPTARCPYCGITWAAWPGSSHTCSALLNAVVSTGGYPPADSSPPLDPALDERLRRAERLRRLEAVREAAEKVSENAYHGLACPQQSNFRGCTCGLVELREALLASDRP